MTREKILNQGEGIASAAVYDLALYFHGSLEQPKQGFLDIFTSEINCYVTPATFAGRKRSSLSLIPRSTLCLDQEAIVSLSPDATTP